MNITRNISKGDIFYIELNRKYFFMQVIHIAENLPPPYEEYKYGYFMVVFEKSFKQLPSSVSDLDMENIYRVKYKPRKTLLYISCWDSEPGIKVDRYSEGWKKYSKYKLVPFGNAGIPESFHPGIIRDFTMPAHFTTNGNGICISHTPAGISYIYSIIEQDEQKRMEKKKDIKPVYFKQWLDDVEPDVILKTEKVIAAFETEGGIKDTRKALKKCITAINRLDDKLHFITSIEAGDIYDLLVGLAVKHGLGKQEAVDTVEENREW